MSEWLREDKSPVRGRRVKKSKEVAAAYKEHCRQDPAGGSSGRSGTSPVDQLAYIMGMVRELKLIARNGGQVQLALVLEMAELEAGDCMTRARHAVRAG